MHNKKDIFKQDDFYFEIDEEIKTAVKTSEDKVKAGIWQYLVDHTTPHPRGYVVKFIVTSEKDFWRRVKARSDGTFKRNNVQKMAKMVEKFIYRSHRRDILDEVLAEIRATGSLYQRSLLKLRYILNKKAGKMAEDRMKERKFKRLY